jgi:hypothetical protein
MNPLPTALSLATLAALLAYVPAAHAQDNAATVEALFEAGKGLMKEGKIAEACPKFLASYNLDHRLGTLLNLADCYERNGQLASGWARFVEAATLAQRANQPERATFASDHARALQPQLSTLVVSVSSPAPGMTVQRDEAALDAGAYGVAVAVDGGKHRVTASAPGKRSWSAEVTIQKTGDRQTLTVPALEDAPVAPAAAAVPEPRPVLSTRRYVGLGAAGAGLVVVGVGAAFGAIAIGKNHDASPDCGIGGNANACNQSGVALRSTAVTDGTISTVFIGVGAAAIVGGAVLWLTGAPSSAKVTVGFDGRSVEVLGRF